MLTLSVLYLKKTCITIIPFFILIYRNKWVLPFKNKVFVLHITKKQNHMIYLVISLSVNILNNMQIINHLLYLIIIYYFIC